MRGGNMYPEIAMRRMGASSLAFPEFRGATRRLVLVNLIAFFVLLVLQVAAHDVFLWIEGYASLSPEAFLHGALWQPLTYSLIHTGLMATLFEMLSLWFLCGFLESYHGDGWLMGLFGSAVLGTAAAALLIYGIRIAAHAAPELIPLAGCFGGIFGMLIVIGVLHGDMEFFLFPLPIAIKARYLAVIYGLIALAMLFGTQQVYAFAQLGGAAAGWFYARALPRKGFSFLFSEQWYGLRNRYYRWKRRRAARKFEVYMKSQGRTVRFDGQGRPIQDDRHDDRSRWN